MSKKRTKSQIAERILYMFTVAITPNIPLFFLYSRNAAQGLLFRHFLIFGGMLALISLIIYLPVSRFLLRRRRTMILLTLFWSAFWFFSALEGIVLSVNDELSQAAVVARLFAIIVIIGFVLRWLSFNRSVANVIAFVLCILFVFNFAPEAIAVLGGEIQRVRNARIGMLPYEIKTEFYINHELPSPNVYWLHIDGMMGFDAVERFFGDSQTDLKSELVDLGFNINESARLEAGFTTTAVPSLTSPTFYDSYLAEEFTRVAHLTHNSRTRSLHVAMREKGFTFEDIHPLNELVKAFSDAGYTTISNQGYVLRSERIDLWIDEWRNVYSSTIMRELNTAFSKLFDFKELIIDASALLTLSSAIDVLFERRRPEEEFLPIPNYPDTESKHISGYSNQDARMASIVRAIKHATTIQTPHIVYFAEWMAHCVGVDGYIIGGVTYEEYIGATFIYDADGNVYTERLEDPHDIQLYFPQHMYAVKQMMAMVDTIIENDPSAVIVIQADHGIHGFGPSGHGFDSEFMFSRGYSFEDQYNLTFSTISAVRIPPQYGTLTQPLDPLDITRWLVNNFVGGGNYEYLYYKEN